MKKILFILFVLFAFQSCLNLDANMFNPTDLPDGYLWDDGAINPYFKLDDTYDVLTDDFHYFTLMSEYEGEQTEIHAVYLGDLETIDTDTVIMYYHGNASNMDHYWPRAKMLYNTGEKSRFGVLMIDYRGFGLSEGEPKEGALLTDVDAALQWLASQGLTDDRLVIYGFSLGSIPSVYLCSEPKSMRPSKIMLEANIGSIDAMAQNGSGLSMPASFFSNLQTNNIEEIKNVDQPLFWIHGLDDGFLSYQNHGLPVFENHSGAYKVSVPVPEGDHGDVPYIFGVENYMDEVLSFLEQ